MLQPLQQGPGQLESYINARKLSAKSAQVDRLRRAVALAAQRTLDGRAQVQLQGSTYMAVALDGTSDADFYVHLPRAAPPVMRAQRSVFAQDLLRELCGAGLAYRELRLGQNRIKGVPAPTGYWSTEAVDFDVVFSRFALDARKPPNRRALAPAVQLTVCTLKLMPEVYTDLVSPQSSALIDWVEGVHNQYPFEFERLLGVVLQLLQRDAPPSKLVLALQRAQQHAERHNPGWDLDKPRRDAARWGCAARRMRNAMASSGRWRYC